LPFDLSNKQARTSAALIDANSLNDDIALAHPKYSDIAAVAPSQMM